MKLPSRFALFLESVQRPGWILKVSRMLGVPVSAESLLNDLTLPTSKPSCAAQNNAMSDHILLGEGRSNDQNAVPEQKLPSLN
jgi:hypothetical protein